MDLGWIGVAVELPQFGAISRAVLLPGDEQQMGVRRIKRYYRYQVVDLNGLRAVRNILNERFDTTDTRRYRLIYPADEIEVETFDEVSQLFVTRGPTARHTTVASSSGGRYASFDATSNSQIVVEYQSGTINVEAEVAKIEKALSLQPLQKVIESAFIGHGFDAKGKAYAQEVGQFLRLLGIRVSTGEYFEPTSVSEKVKRRIAENDLFVAIVTAQDDRTWIIQETTYADSLNKQPFVLIETTVDQKRALRGDKEDIFFPDGHVSEAFIKILQGMRKLRGDHE